MRTEEEIRKEIKRMEHVLDVDLKNLKDPRKINPYHTIRDVIASIKECEAVLLELHWVLGEKYECKFVGTELYREIVSNLYPDINLAG